MATKEIMTILLSFCGGIITISSALSAITNWVNKARQPEIKQNERLTACEAKIKEHDEQLSRHMGYFKNDDVRLKKIEESNKITQKSMLALLKHLINGEDLDSLRKAEKDLEEYLINRTD